VGTATDQVAAPAPDAPERANPAAPALDPEAVLVADGMPAGPGQLTRAAFLERLERAVRGAVDEVLRPSGRSTEDCPYLNRYLDRLRLEPVERLTAVVRLWVHPVRDTPDDWMDAIAARAGSAAEAWRDGRPDALVSEVTPTGAADFQESSDRARPEVVLGALGDGQALPGGVRSRAERAFGVDFSHVRIHVDEAAQRVAAESRARAFTVGDHVGFAAGQFQPGTRVGDAVLAHELAHTLQQHGSTQASAADPSLEHDADRAAVAGDGRSISSGRGLMLQCCGTEDSDFDENATIEEIHKSLPTPEEMIEGCTSAGNLDEDKLGKKLARLLWFTTDHADYVLEVFEALEDHNKDDVAAIVLSHLQDHDLAWIAQDPRGRRLLEYLVPALTEGWTFPGSDIYAATRAIRAARARTSSATASEAELKTLKDVAAAAKTAKSATSGTAGDAERRALVQAKLNRMTQTWTGHAATTLALRQAQAGLAKAGSGGAADKGRVAFAEGALDLLEPQLIAVAAELKHTYQNQTGSQRARMDLLEYAQLSLLEALGALCDTNGPQKLASAQAVVNRLPTSLSKVELAVYAQRPVLFEDVKAKAAAMRSFAEWTVAEIEASATAPSGAAKVETSLNACRLLAHWEILIEVAEALESGFNFTAVFYGHGIDVDDVQARIVAIAAYAKAGDPRFRKELDAFISDKAIKAYYDDVPNILRSSGIAIAIAVMVAASLVTMGAGSLVSGALGAGAAATGTAGAAAAGATQSLSTVIALSAVDALVFTTVQQAAGAALGVQGGKSFLEELLWNFGMFGVLKIAGRYLPPLMRARGLTRVQQGAVFTGVTVGVLEGYGILRFTIEEGRLPNGGELAKMNAEMIAILAIMVVIHRVVESKSALGRFDKEFGTEFRAIEKERAALQSDISEAVRTKTLETQRDAFKTRGDALEKRVKNWSGKASASAVLPDVRAELGKMKDVQEIGRRALAEAMGLPPEVAIERAGGSDFTIANGQARTVADKLQKQGAEVRVTSGEGQPTVVEARFPGENVQLAERPATAAEKVKAQAVAAETAREAKADAATESAASIADDLSTPLAPKDISTQFPAAIADGRFTNAKVEADFQAYVTRGGVADRATWMSRTGGGPLARLRVWLGKGFRPPQAKRHVDRPRLKKVAGETPAALDAVVKPYHDPVRAALRARQEAILKHAETDPKAAGMEYQELVAQDLKAVDVQEWMQRNHRRNDIGGGAGSAASTRGIEVTIEGWRGPMSTSKLDQLWLDLQQTGGITLVVPKLSAQARLQIFRLVKQFQAAHPDKAGVTVGVRETLPPTSSTQP